MRLRFRTKLLASHVGLASAIVLLVIAVLDVSLRGDLERQLDERLLQQAHGAAQWISAGRHPERLASRLAQVVNAGVTITDKEGVLIGDSDLDEGKAGLAPAIRDLPEIAAIRGGAPVGRATRPNPKGGGDVRYLAVPTESGLVLRLAVPLSGIRGTIGAMQGRLLLASGVAAAFALALGALASRLAARPLRAMTDQARRIADGDYDTAVATRAPDEFGELSRSLAKLASQLKARIGDLTAERDRLTAILAGMQEAVLVADAHGTIELANEAAARMFPARSPLVGEPLEEALALPDVSAVVDRARSSGSISEGETEEEGAAGRALATYARPLGEGVVAVIRDMTEVRRLERVRRDFVANASHELRTPVTAIQGYAETLLHGTADAATSKRFLEIVHRHARRLGALLESLLRLSELEAKAPSAVPREPLHVAEIANDVLDGARARARDADMRLEARCDADAVAIGDPLGVAQILENLVDNAIKYGKPGAEVRVGARRAGDRVLIDVADTGPGLEAAHLARVFERFYRAESSRVRERVGSGLGLAIVKHLVESMGGRIEVGSQLGEGTTFHIDLPAVERSRDAAFGKRAAAR